MNLSTENINFAPLLYEYIIVSQTADLEILTRLLDAQATHTEK